MNEKYHQELGDERWLFIMHIVGCRSCGSYGYYSVKSARQAYNFQIIKLLIFMDLAITELLSPKIKRIRNETDTPMEYVDPFNVRPRSRLTVNVFGFSTSQTEKRQLNPSTDKR